MVKCEECGWEGEWEEVLVEVFEGDRVVLARDPLRVHLDPPYFCPECESETLCEAV